jgi:replicative DNA helicase
VNLTKDKNGLLNNGKVSYNKRVSPLNLDYFEKILCYRSLFDTTYLASIVDHINPKYFKDKNIAKVFVIICGFYNKRNKLPTLTEVKSYLTTEELKQSFKDLVHSLQEIDKNLDYDELYENTERFLKEKAVYHTMLEVAGDIAKGDIDTSVILQKVEKSCSINLVTDTGFSLSRDIDTLITDITTTQKTIPSTWPWLDQALNGGFLENGRALYVFAGETNIGKSIFLGNIATNLAQQGKNVLLVTLEMSELLYARRLVSNISKIPLNDLKNNTAYLKEVIKEQNAQGKGNILIKEFPPATITPNSLNAFIKKVVDSGIKIDAIVIDYLNLLHSTIGNNSYERIKHVTEQVRAMTYTFNCPAISATQLNRSGVGQENPELSTISESIGLAATADVIVSIFQNEEDREIGVIRLGMMKNRYGLRGHTQAMRIDYSTLTITQAEEDFASSEEDTLNTLQMLSS